jgi:hypothetical protein
MPTQQPAHRSSPHQRVLPFDRSKQPLSIPRSLDLIQRAPQQVGTSLTEEQQRDLRPQLIQILQEALRHADQHR